MSEIAKCPLCGAIPVVGIHSGFVFCCGMKSDAIDAEKSAKLWNQYSAEQLDALAALVGEE